MSLWFKIFQTFCFNQNAFIEYNAATTDLTQRLCPTSTTCFPSRLKLKEKQHKEERSSFSMVVLLLCYSSVTQVDLLMSFSEVWEPRDTLHV